MPVEVQARAIPNSEVQIHSELGVGGGGETRNFCALAEMGGGGGGSFSYSRWTHSTIPPVGVDENLFMLVDHSAIPSGAK